MISRRTLYAAGETFGDACTRREAGRLLCGGGGDSSSSSSTATSTTNIDKRMALSSGVGVSSDSSTVNVNSLDGGAIAQALGFAGSALDSIKSSDATNAQGFTALLSSVNKTIDANTSAGTGAAQSFNGLLKLAGDLFATGSQMIGKTQDATLAQLATINTAANDQKGAIDQKTIIVLAVAGAAAVVLSKRKA